MNTEYLLKEEMETSKENENFQLQINRFMKLI